MFMSSKKAEMGIGTLIIFIAYYSIVWYIQYNINSVIQRN